MNQILDDKSRFISFLELLPEKFVNDFVNYYLFNAYYPREHNVILDKYNDRKSEIMSEFSNTKINESYRDLNNTFDVLRKFLINHFDIPNDHYKMYENPTFLYLDPRSHHNFRISYGAKEEDTEKDSMEWNKLKSELDNLAENFERAYKDFIKMAKKKLEIGEGEGSHLKWAKQHVTEIVIGVIVTVIAGIILSWILL